MVVLPSWLAQGGASVSSPSKGKSTSAKPQSKAPEPQPPAPVADVEMRHEHSEPDLPYTARQSAMYEKSLVPFGGEEATLPTFKPVDWSQQVVYYDDDESEMGESTIALSASADITVDDAALSESAMDVDVPVSSSDAQMDELQDRPRPRSGSIKSLTLDLSLSPTFTKTKSSLVESASPAQLRASLSPVNAFTILSHPPPRPGGMTVDSPSAGFIAPISI